MLRLRVQTIRSLLWLGNALVVAGIVGLLANIVLQHRKKTLMDWMPKEQIEKYLNVDGTIEPATDRGSLAELTEYRQLWQLNVTGKEPPKPVDSEQLAADATVGTLKPIQEVLQVVLALAHPSNPAKSHVQIHYLEDGPQGSGGAPTPTLPVGRGGVGVPRGGGAPPAQASALRPGQRSDAQVAPDLVKIGNDLRAPYNAAPYNGKVVDITNEGVVFQWGEEQVTLGVPIMEPGVTGGVRTMDAVDAQGNVIPGSAINGAVAAEPAPRETRRISDNEWFIGTEERQRLMEEHEALLDEITVKNEFIAADKRVRLVLAKVPEDSLVYQRGFREGDVLRKINGEEIQSKASVIQYFKRNPNLSSYRIEIERKGAIVNRLFNTASY